MAICGSYAPDVPSSGAGQEGGYSGNPSQLSVDSMEAYSPSPVLYDSSVSTFTGADPVDMATGAMLYDHADLVVGSGSLPTGLSLQRRYSSLLHSQKGPFGYGWNHNLQMTARRYSDYVSMLGGRLPAEAAPALLTYAILLRHWDVSSADWMRTSLIIHWLMDRLTDNAVSIRTGSETMSYTRMPEGNYVKPPKIAAALTADTNDCFTLTQPDGAVSEFDADGNDLGLPRPQWQ